MNPAITVGGSAVSPRFILASLFFHCLIIAAASLAVNGRADQPPPTPTGAVRVRLVNMPALPVSADKVNTATLSESSNTNDAPDLVESPKEARSHAVQSVKTTARSFALDHVRLAKRTRAPKRSEAVKPSTNPRNTPDKGAEETGAERIEKRLAGIRDEVEKRKRATESGPEAGSPDPNAAAGTDPDLTAWLSRVRSRINENWTLFQEVRDKSAGAVVGVRIAADGALVGAVVDKGSGDEVFDRSALRAVYQASPLPPPPESVRRRIADSGGLALRFTSRGMQ